MRNVLTIAAAIVALCAGVISSSGVAAARPGLHYDCTKKANANKSACKTAATTSVTPLAPPLTPAELKAKPKKLSKQDIARELATVQAPTPQPSAGGPSNSQPVAGVRRAEAHPVCKKGKPCGNSCIAQSKVCHKT